MLPYHLQTIAPIIKANSRLLFLTSGASFGSTDVHDEHLIERMNQFVGNIENQEPKDIYDRIRNVGYPDLNRERVVGEAAPSDIMISDISRQNKSIEERFRKGLTGIGDLRRLTDVATRYHIAMSRGFERHLVNLINNMDSEAFNRQTVRPLV